jgi:DNA polymerase/3'-5' exonuclease PolX
MINFFKRIKKIRMSTMRINNNSYIGNSITITNGKVIIDGKDVTPDSKTITISVEGNIDNLTVDACDKVTVTGDVNKVKTMSGDVDIKGNVTDSVSTMSGDVDCGNIGGSIKTMSGDIKHR